MCNVWICDKQFSFDDSNFSKIFRFFVIETPIEFVSVRSISFEKRKINKKSLNSKIQSLKERDGWNPIYSDDDNDLKEEIASLGIISHTDKYTEKAFFLTKKGYDTINFLYAIRCAFAHGAFCIHPNNDEKYYYFENVYNENNNSIIKARIILKEDTLLNIVDFCNSKL